MTPQTISHYRILRRLGAGGMGEVFLAQDTRLDRKVAIKCIREVAVGSEEARKRLIREARAAATLDHPNICTIHEIGEEGQRAFLVMQYVEGETLSLRLDRDPPNLQQSVEIAVQIAKALNEAHFHGIVHRDIKPQNIIITPAGQVKVLDFGLAKLLWSGAADSLVDTQTMLTETGVALGTVNYMSPEQARGEHVDARSDLFALGALLYKCVTGRSAFYGKNTIEVGAQIIHVTPTRPSQLNPAVPPELDSIILKALEKKIVHRYQSAEEVLTDLGEFQRTYSGAGYSSLPQSGLVTRRLPKSGTSGLVDRFRGVAGRRAVLAVVLPIATILVILLGFLNWPAGAHQPTAGAMRSYEKGAEALRDGAYYQASKALLGAVELDHNFALAHARLAEAYAEMDYMAKAKQELLLAQTLDRKVLSEKDRAYLKAISAVVLRDFSTAIETYLSLVQQAADPEKSSILFDLGRTYEKSDNLDKAIETYLEVTQRDSQSAGAFLRMGVLYGRQGESKNAEKAFNRADELYEQWSNNEGQSEVLYQRGILLQATGKPSEAREKLDKSLGMARAASNIYQEIRILLPLSDASWNEGNSAKAKEYASDAIQLAQNNDLRNLATNGLIDLGYAFMSRGELEESGKYINQALVFAEADKSALGRARSMLALGNLSLQLDNANEAIRCLTEARRFYQEAGYRRQTSTCMLLLSRANRMKGEYAASVEVSQQQLNLSTALNDLSQIAAAHSNIGYVLGIEQEQYTEGLIHMDESYKLNESLGDTLGVAYDLMHRGRLLWPLGRYDEARVALQRAFTIANQPDGSYKPVLAWVNLANAQMYLSESRFAEASRESEKARELSSDRYKELAIEAQSTLGLAQALSSQPRAGKKLCEEAVADARKTSSPRLLSKSLSALAEVLLKTGDAKDALNNAAQAQALAEKSGLQESGWRAWLIAARASQTIGSPSTLEFARRAEGSLSSFVQQWTPESRRLYLNRADVKSSRKQIDQMLGSRK